MSLPKDPVILLSFVNTQLRDHYSSLSELAGAYMTEASEIESILEKINYKYDKTLNKFI